MNEVHVLVFSRCTILIDIVRLSTTLNQNEAVKSFLSNNNL